MSALDIEKDGFLTAFPATVWDDVTNQPAQIWAINAWQGWLAAKRTAQPAVAGGDGLTDEQIERMWTATADLPCGDHERMLAFARAIAAHVSGQGGEDARIVELARKLVQFYDKTLPRMYCDGEPVGSELVAAIAAKESSSGSG